MFAMVAIIVAMVAAVVPILNHSVSRNPLLAGLLGTTISQPGSTLALCPTLATVPFIYII